MVRLRFLPVAVLALVTGVAQAQTPTTQRQEVQDFVRAYAEAANRGDVTAYMEMYSRRPDLIEVSNGTIKRGWDTLRDDANNMLGMEGSYRFSVGTMDVLGLGTTRAIVVFPFVATVTIQQGSVQFRGAMTLVLEKGPQGWRIIHDHTSTVPAVEGGIAVGVVGGTGPVTAETYLEAEVDDPVSTVNMPRPRYPPVMQQMGISGRVEVEYVVDTTGRAEPASWRVIRSSNKAFEEPAREAIMKGVFKPARIRGQAVRQLVQHAISFNVGQ